MRWWARAKQQPFWIRLLNWEYWPSIAFYWPMIFYAPWLMLRSRHPCFFSPANPGIYTGGFGMESKYETLHLIPEEYRPRSIFIEGGSSFEQVLPALAAAGISFPLIAKPDIGFRGFLVKRIETAEELQAYLRAYPVDFILQEFLKAEGEFGVFYYRMPGEPKGKVTSLTLKTFLSVTGNGRSTVSELIQAKPRALLQWERLQTSYAHLFDQVPGEGEVVPLGVIGNHSKGTRFINGGHFIDGQLTDTFDRIAQRIEGFSYGRFDVKCDSLEDLKVGRNLKIMELNGVCSEPTHMYDPEGCTYWGAVGEVVRYWTLIRRVGEAHHRQGVPYHDTWAMIKAMIRLKLHMRRLRRLVREGEELGHARS